MGNKVFAFLTILALSATVVSAGKVDYHDRNIADDSIAFAIRSPRPVAVTELVDAMKTKHPVDTVEELDVSENTICLKGAAQIFEFAKGCPNLRRLSLAFNRIYDSRSEKDYEAFETALLELLQNVALEEIDLHGNGIANLYWVAYLESKLSRNLIRKIRWEN
jgi:hypothetical protein